MSSFGLAQQNENGNFFTRDMEYQLKANFGIGGSAPFGMPREIRKINNYNPTLVLGLEADATKWVSDNKKWGIRVGIRIEGKGMKTEAVVKNYFTEVIQGDEKIKGYFTGTVETDIKNTYVTMPVSVVYKVSPRWKLYGGLYASLLVDKNFSGYVSNGHLRQNTPVERFFGLGFPGFRVAFPQVKGDAAGARGRIQQVLGFVRAGGAVGYVRGA